MSDKLEQAKEDPKSSLEMAIAFGSYDYSTYDRHAWIYGIICGWDNESLKELALKHSWNSVEINRLKRLNKKFKALK